MPQVLGLLAPLVQIVGRTILARVAQCAARATISGAQSGRDGIPSVGIGSPRLGARHGSLECGLDLGELLGRSLVRGLRGSACSGSRRSEALGQALERVADDFVVASIRQRSRRVARCNVLASIGAHRRSPGAAVAALRARASTVCVRRERWACCPSSSSIAQPSWRSEDVPALLHRAIGGDERLQRPVGHERSRVSRAVA